ncbi:MAG: hypothetical protein LBT05_01135 [Planctomycetaceae bacterium]|nr:hypothetical protein [Planctomycetaceae bacterium]
MVIWDNSVCIKSAKKLFISYWGLKGRPGLLRLASDDVPNGPNTSPIAPHFFDEKR